MQFLLLAFAALLFSFGGLAMKASAELTRIGPSVGVFALFCAGAAAQAIGMRRTEMGVVYVSVLGLEAIAAFALSFLALGERVTISKVGALLLIVGGTALLERHSRSFPMVTASQADKIIPEEVEDRRRLRDLTGVGSAIEADLRALDVHSVPELAACEGDELYRNLCDLTGTRQDPCVLDTLRCAVAQARDPHLPAEKRNWWWWSRQRKAGRFS